MRPELGSTSVSKFVFWSQTNQASTVWKNTKTENDKMRFFLALLLFGAVAMVMAQDVADDSVVVADDGVGEGKGFKDF